MLFVTVGTGIGGAVVLNGRIWRGAGGLAGEIGHVTAARTAQLCACGRPGCVSLFASGPAIERRLGLHHGSLLEGAIAPDGRLRAAVRNGADALGVAIANVLNVLNLPLVVLAGGVAEIGEGYRAAVEHAARREVLPEMADDCRFELSRAGYGAGALGAALLAGCRLHLPAATPVRGSRAVVI